MTNTRILIVDDSPLIRKVLLSIFEQEPDFEVVGEARDGEDAIRLAVQHRPDVITMDVEMPRLNGIQAVTEILKVQPTPIIMVSTLTKEGAETTMQALQAGAVDFVCKPSNSQPETLLAHSRELIAKIRHARFARVTARVKGFAATAPTRIGNKVVVVASSTGGPKALTTFFETLPKGLNVPILIVQHMPEGFTASLAARLDSIGVMKVREAKRGDTVQPGLALVAPGGFHMRVGSKGEIILDEESRIHGVRPAADFLFLTAVKTFGSRCVGVVLTGMGRDGAAGAAAIRKSGGVVFGESAETCTVYGMPKAALDVGGIDAEFPIDKIGQAVVAALRGDKRSVA